MITFNRGTKLEDEKLIVKLSTLGDNELLEDYKKKKVKKIGKPLEFKIGDDKWKLQRIEQIEHPNYFHVFIATRYFYKEEEVITGGLGSYRKRTVKKEHNIPVREVYTQDTFSMEDIIQCAKEQLGYVQCSFCEKFIYGNEPRLEQDKWWCKNCFLINFEE